MSLLSLIVAMNDGHRIAQEIACRRQVKYKRTKSTCCIAVVDGVKKADANYATVAELRSLGIEYREAVKIVKHRPYNNVEEVFATFVRVAAVREKYSKVLYVGEVEISLNSLV